MQEAPRQHRLLLIAAGQAADRLVEPRRDDAEIVDQRLRRAALLRAETMPAEAKSSST